MVVRIWATRLIVEPPWLKYESPSPMSIIAVAYISRSSIRRRTRFMAIVRDCACGKTWFRADQTWRAWPSPRRTA